MRINRVNTANNNPKQTDKIQELTIYHYLTNNNSINVNTNSNNISTKSQTINNNYNLTDLSNDDYLLELHKKLEEKRKIRRISEQGVKLLNGRVRCLKDENKKTLAKIDLTRRKTQEKVLALKYNKSRSKEKKEYLQRKEDNLKLLKQKNRHQKLLTQSNILNNKENLILQNQIKGKQSKAQKIDNENAKRENELNAQIFKKNKIEVIRTQFKLGSQKKQILDIKKKEKLIKDLEKKINLELQKKNEYDEELNKLNEQENEILSRILQNTEMQRKLIEDFEKNYTCGGNNRGMIMSLNNNNISCIKRLDQFDDDYDDEEIKDF
jgi:hypothetical protein